MDAAEWLGQRYPDSDTWKNRDDLIATLSEILNDGWDDDTLASLDGAVAESRWDMRIAEAIRALESARAAHHAHLVAAEKTKEELYRVIRDAYAAGLEKIQIHRLSGVSRPTVDKIVSAGPAEREEA